MNRIPRLSLEITSIHAVIGFQMTDDRIRLPLIVLVIRLSRQTHKGCVPYPWPSTLFLAHVSCGHLVPSLCAAWFGLPVAVLSQALTGACP